MPCACTDIRYRPRGPRGRVSVCMDCGQVHKVWPDAENTPMTVQRTIDKFSILIGVWIFVLVFGAGLLLRDAVGALAQRLIAAVGSL